MKLNRQIFIYAISIFFALNLFAQEQLFTVENIKEPLIYGTELSFIYDVNNDGNRDLIVANEVFQGDVSDGVVIFLNKENGSFEEYFSYKFPFKGKIEILDYDEDGDFDIILRVNNFDFYLIRLTSALKFSDAKFLYTLNGFVNLQYGKFNHDNDADLLYYLSGSVHIRHSNLGDSIYQNISITGNNIC